MDGIVGIPEMGGTSGGSGASKMAKMTPDPMKFSSPPYLMRVYKDPVDKTERVILSVTLFSGVEKFKTNLDDEGRRVKIEYDWPFPMHNIKMLFLKPEGGSREPEFHPKVLSLEEELETRRKSIYESPKGIFDIELPIQVQTDSSKWKLDVIKVYGTTVLMMEFCGIQSSYTRAPRVVDLTKMEETKSE